MASARKLGKLPPRRDPRNLRLARFLGPLPAPPTSVDWAGKIPVDWTMMGNDVAGDCAFAAAGHAIQTWTGNVGPSPVVLPEAQILDEYSLVTGYDGTPSTDNGAVELDVLVHWRHDGFAGQPLGAFLAIHPLNAIEVKQAISLFGGVYLGIGLPITAQTDTVWDLPPAGLTGDGAAGSWGGHAVWVPAYDLAGLTCVTWGSLQRMTWRFLTSYCDEAYALLSPLWTGPDELAPNGILGDVLAADLALLDSA